MNWKPLEFNKKNLEVLDYIIEKYNSTGTTIEVLDNALTLAFICKSALSSEYSFMSRFRRLCYDIDYNENGTVIRCRLIINYRLNIENTANIKTDLSNCEIDNILYDIYNIDDPEFINQWDEHFKYSSWIDKSIQEGIENVPKSELKEILNNYILNGLD